MPLNSSPFGVAVRGAEGNQNDGVIIPETTKVVDRIHLRIKNQANTDGKVVLFDTHKASRSALNCGNEFTSDGISVELGGKPGDQYAVTTLFNSLIGANYKIWGVRFIASALSDSIARAQMDQPAFYYYFNIDSTIADQGELNRIDDLSDDRHDGKQTILLQKELLVHDRFAITTTILAGATLDLVLYTEAAVNER